MHFNHLGLPVRDERRSQQFYSAYFGFDPATAQEYPDGTVIIRNADAFDLALHPPKCGDDHLYHSLCAGIGLGAVGIPVSQIWVFGTRHGQSR